MSDKTVNEEASRLFHDPKITARLAELRKPAVDALRVTLRSHLASLHDLREQARGKGQYSAAISAEVARAKAARIYEGKGDEPELTPEEQTQRLIAILAQAARRRPSGGPPLLTPFLRAAFETERPAFVALVKEFLRNEKAARENAIQ